MKPTNTTEMSKAENTQSTCVFDEDLLSISVSEGLHNRTRAPRRCASFPRTLATLCDRL